MRNFFDTSAVVKLYIPEAETTTIQAEVNRSTELLISYLTVLEFRSAVYGMVRQGRVSQADCASALSIFDASLTNYSIVPVNDSILAAARTLLDLFAVSNGLRPADAIQIACAEQARIVSPLDGFITTDRQQASVAIARGLVVSP